MEASKFDEMVVGNVARITVTKSVLGNLVIQVNGERVLYFTKGGKVVLCQPDYPDEIPFNKREDGRLKIIDG